MPTYDFMCFNCRKYFSVFLTYSQYDTTSVICPLCNSTNLKRIIRNVRLGRTTDIDLNSFDNESDSNLLEQDPREFGKLMRQMSQETGEDIGPEFNDLVNRLEKGEHPEEIAKSSPDLPEE